MTSPLMPLWLGAAAAGIWIVVSLARSARRKPDRVAPRSHAVLVAAGATTLAVLAAWVFSIGPARDGAARIRAATGDTWERSPARARLFLRQVTLAPDTDRVGYSPEADLVLPSSYRLEESERGWDLFELERSSAGLIAQIVESPEKTTTRLSILASDGPANATELVAALRACTDQPTAPTQPSAHLAIALCSGSSPRAVLAFDATAGAVLLTAHVWRSRRLEPHHIEIEPSALVQIGAVGAALPGVTLWEVPTPADRSELFASPANLLATCGAFAGSIYSGEAAAAPAAGRGAVCQLPLSPPFALEVRRLLPDVGGAAARALWAVGLLVLPILGWALLLCARPRSGITRSDIAGLARLATVAVIAGAIGCARLLWAHRIDMLRDWEVAGIRVAGNQISIVCVAAAVAAMAAGLAVRGSRARLWASGGAFVATLAIGSIGIPGGFPLGSGGALAELALAAAVGTTPLWYRHAAAALDRRSPLMVALAVAAIALLAASFAPRAVTLKLGLAWAAVVAAYRAIRVGVTERDTSAATLFIHAGAAAAAVAAFAVFDTGLAVVIAAPGLLVAAALAGHDALYGETAAGEVDSYRQRHAPLLWLQGGIVGAALATCLVWSTAGLASGVDAELARRLTNGAPHLAWLIAALLATPAIIAWRRGDRRTAILFAVASAAAVLGWALRGVATEIVIASSTPAAQRYAVIADPGYALLANPDAFLAGVTGWAETILPSAAGLWGGEGYFGAQLLDPGVLLSVENDYLPVLILREQGALGIATWSATALGAVAAAWLLGRERLLHGSASSRARLAVAVVLGALVVYQPLAALGALPLTGVSWPGLGIDSPSDLWMVIGLLVWLSMCASPPGDDACDPDLVRYDRELRGTRRFVRSERLMLLALVLAIGCGVALTTRGAAFALTRPPPVDGEGLASEPFAGLEVALDYARSLRCEIGEGDPRLLGQPTDRATRRYHRRLARRFERSGRPRAVRFGLVEIRETLGESEGAAPGCRVKIDGAVLRALRLPELEPYRGARIRLVAKAMGAAALDRGELISGNIAVRLRPTAGTIDAPRSAGIYAARRVDLSPELSVELGVAGTVTLTRRAATATEAGSSWLFVSRRARPKAGLRPLEGASRWEPMPTAAGARILDQPALLVVGSGRGRSVWLFRPARVPGSILDPVADEPSTVEPLLADDSFMITGERRRLYVYGNQMPELGWVNRFRRRMSLGLDGWVAASLAEFDPRQPSAPTSCGTLKPAPTNLGQVCSPDASGGVLECRVALQPELAIRMRHLGELAAANPDAIGGIAGRWKRPLRAQVFLLRGDTGEIVATADHVTGRASPAYAPATRALETHLIRVREDRDPRTGRRLPAAERGEASSEKVERNRAIAVGSIVKPMLARAFEQTAPGLARDLILSGAPFAGGACRGGRSHAVLGHCPPTDSLWNQRRSLDLAGFLAVSANWYNAAIALIGTALPDGSVGLGDGPAVPLEELAARSVGDHALDWALWTRRDGSTVIGADHRVRIDALRSTPMWRRFEAILGRPLCAAGNKSRCRQLGARRDLCAVRALPLPDAGADLRHLVSLGPDRFDFYPRLRRKERTLERSPTREYLQFLRGSGIHPIGSLAQMTSAFNRVIFEAGRDPLRDGPYRLAASWFPAPAVGVIPRRSCSSAPRGRGVTAGLCESIRNGTAARSLGPLLADPRIEIYGVKTGTIDSLGDIAASPTGCERFRQGHTLDDRRRHPDSQPYWISCGKSIKGIDDSLVLISFAVITPSGERVPLTLGLAFQRSGGGYAAAVARRYIDVVRDYFAAGVGGLP